MSAARLSTRDGQSLLDALRADEHIGPFLAIPSKDNGLDIEGLVAIPPRLLVGLRGPVLRGWAILLELEPRLDPADPTLLQLAPLDSPAGPRYRKHFLDLDGLGVRDLTRDRDDLLILAGPTMLLDGPSRILRIPHGASHSLPQAVRSNDLVQLGDDLIVGRGHDHPEAITVIPTASGQPGPTHRLRHTRRPHAARRRDGGPPGTGLRPDLRRAPRPTAIDLPHLYTVLAARGVLGPRACAEFSTPAEPPGGLGATNGGPGPGLSWVRPFVGDVWHVRPGSANFRGLNRLGYTVRFDPLPDVA